MEPDPRAPRATVASRLQGPGACCPYLSSCCICHGIAMLLEQDTNIL